MGDVEHQALCALSRETGEYIIQNALNFQSRILFLLLLDAQVTVNCFTGHEIVKIQVFAVKCSFW